MPSVKTNFSLKDKDIERIRLAMVRCGETSESVINDYLHNVAGTKLTRSITKFIPVSKRNKQHAKSSKWHEQANYNKAVSISNSLKGSRGTSFYYLYYVVTGTGTNRKKGARDFMEKGMNLEHNNIVEGLVEELDRYIEREVNKNV